MWGRRCAARGCSTVGGGRRGDARQRIPYRAHERLIAPRGLLPALEDGRVAGLDGQRGDLDDGLGARFENDGEDADGAGDAPQVQAHSDLAVQGLGACGFSSRGDVQKRAK